MGNAHYVTTARMQQIGVTVGRRQIWRHGKGIILGEVAFQVVVMV